MIISKELLSEVLGKEMNPLRGEPQHIGNDVFYGTADDSPKRINIHELTNKIIEWGSDWEVSPEALCSHKTFYVTTDGSEWYCGYAHIKTTYDDKQTVKDVSKGKTLHEAVVVWGEWIMEQNTTP